MFASMTSIYTTITFYSNSRGRGEHLINSSGLLTNYHLRLENIFCIVVFRVLLFFMSSVVWIFGRLYLIDSIL